ncbi:MAG: S41 family peptidase [Firmicutes bacterium]|nr:S41 family peptidase [Bacillota bacterium]
MRNPYGRQRGFAKGAISILAVLLFAGIFFAGGVIASNYKHAGNLIKVYSLVKSQYLKEVNTTKLVDGAIGGMVESLDDPYSAYLDAETYAHLQEQIRGTFGGLGILVGMTEDYLTVVRSFEGTPAAEEGIEPGDKIQSIDGKNARGMDLETAVGVMRGPVGTEIELTLIRDGRESPLHVTLTREEIIVPTVVGSMVEGTKVAHVAIAQFNEKTPGELESALKKVKKEGMRALILDLRNNPGGELIAAKEVADKLIPEGPVVTVDYRAGKDHTYEADGRYLDIPLVVLVNGNSASASEIVAGAVKDTEVGKLLGTTTFGKGIVQTVFPLDNGAALKLTTARYLTPDGHNIHGKGITPDITVPEEPGNREDVQLKKAVELLKK